MFDAFEMDAAAPRDPFAPLSLTRFVPLPEIKNEAGEKTGGNGALETSMSIPQILQLPLPSASHHQNCLRCLLTGSKSGDDYSLYVELLLFLMLGLKGNAPTHVIRRQKNPKQQRRPPLPRPLCWLGVVVHARGAPRVPRPPDRRGPRGLGAEREAPAVAGGDRGGRRGPGDGDGGCCRRRWW